MAWCIPVNRPTNLQTYQQTDGQGLGLGWPKIDKQTNGLTCFGEDLGWALFGKQSGRQKEDTKKPYQTKD